MPKRKTDIGYSVQLIIKQLDNDKAIEIYDMYEVCFNQKEIIESSGFFHENLIHFLETRIFTEKK